MNIENFLGKTLEYKSRTRVETTKLVEEIFIGLMCGFGYLMRPIINPFERMLDKIYNLVN